jgi:hypothetical protein
LETSPVAKLSYAPALPAECIKNLDKALESLGLKVEHAARDETPQMAIEWALPALAALGFFGGGVAGKRFFDSFFQELGVDKAGTALGKAVKAVFLSAVDLPNRYVRTRKDGTEEVSRPPALAIGLHTQATSPDQIPSSLAFLFDHEIARDFDASLISMRETTLDNEKLRQSSSDMLRVRFSKSERYLGRKLDELGPWNVFPEMERAMRACSGHFVFDPESHAWIKIDDSGDIDPNFADNVQKYLDFIKSIRKEH